MFMVIIAQTARIIIDNLLNLGAFRLHFHDFINLLLIFGQHHMHPGMIKHILQFFGDHVFVKRNRDSPQALRGTHTPVKLRSVGAYNAEFVATLKADCGQPIGKGKNLVLHLKPAPGLPDPKLFFTHSRVIAAACSMMQQ